MTTINSRINSSYYPPYTPPVKPDTTENNAAKAKGVLAGAEEIAPQSAKDEFMAFMKKSPAEKMREMILRECGVTEEDLQSMDAASRAKIEKKIAERIREMIRQQAEKETGVGMTVGSVISMAV